MKTLVLQLSYAKFILLLLMLMFTFCDSSADNYRVNTSSGLNVRVSANKNSEVLGTLSQGDVIDVYSIENGWAAINYNGTQGYVSTSYIEAVANNKGRAKASGKKSWSLFSWLFNSEGESTLFTIVKWFLFIVIAVFLIKLALLIIIRIIAFGLVMGAVGLFIGYVLNWIGWIESDTMWSIGRWGFYIGNGLGLLHTICNFGEVLDEAAETSTGSSTSNSDGLKKYSIVGDYGKEYILTQNSKYSECSYTDQYGKKWERDSSGFHRV